MKLLFTAVLLGTAALAASDAHAQFIVPGPSGSLGFSNGNGTYTYVYPGRMNPWANSAQPGSVTSTPWGTAWVGQDNQVHGNFVDPATGNVHLRHSPRTSGRSYTRQPSYRNNYSVPRNTPRSPTYHRPPYHGRTAGPRRAF